MLCKKSENCIAFLVPSLHCKLALFKVPYALRSTFIPSLRFGTGYASPYNPCHCLKLKNSKLNLLIILHICHVKIFVKTNEELSIHSHKYNTSHFN
ncbi:MAG: hypothetical protein MR739_06800 [Spirochaetia bacterium]|nr:hypothetical protein [Spirochaetia bacterium]